MSIISDNQPPHIGNMTMNNENEKKEVLVKNSGGFRKAAGLIILFVVFCAAGAAATYYFLVRDATQGKDEQVQIMLREKEELSSANKSLEEKLDRLSADYDKIYKDRENIIEQSRRIIQEKNALLNVQTALEEVTEEKEQYLKEKEETAQELDSLISQTKQIKDKYEQELSLAKKQIKTYQEEVAEKNKINEELINKTRVRELEASVKTLKGDNKDLAQKLREIGLEKDKLDRQLEQNKKEYDKEQLTLQKRYDDLSSQYEELTTKYRKLEKEQEVLNKRLAEFPSKIANLAAENKRLVGETADMHYNLGLFYFRKQEYKRALPEFERTIKINPQDAESYYYLGYIYAEYFMKQDKAIEYFDKYVELAPRGIHSAWVNQYILSWRIWDEKENIE